FDRAHVLQIGWVYELPVGKGKMFAKSGVAAQVLGGWQVNGIVSAYTGTPFTVGDTAAVNAPNNTQTANQVNPVVNRIGDVGPGTRYYDITAFASVPTVNTFGSTGRNILRNPGVWNTDLNITREFPIKESLKMQFRGEFYNLPNTSHFGGMQSANVGSG